MQIAIKCKNCGHTFVSDKDSDLAVEIDFSSGEIRCVCRSCKHENILSLAPKDSKRLPPIGLSRF